MRDDVIERLYETHYDSLLRLAFLIVGRDAAEDLVQDAFVKALDKWRRDAPAEAFRSWAQTTMVRMAISKWRRSSREQVAFERHGADDDVRPAEAFPEVSVALGALTPRQRTATVLRYYEDLTEAQILSLIHI